METSPVMLRMQLAVALRKLREQAGLSADELAKRIGSTKSSVSRYEGGTTVPRVPILRAILAVYRMDDERREELEIIARQAWQRKWWKSVYGDVQVPDWFSTYAGLEPEADRLSIWQQYIPGLLQTHEYAQHIISADTDDPVEVDNLVLLRMARQDIFHREKPPEVHVVLDEAALRRQVGGQPVMRRQIQRLVERALLPNVTIQVLPFDRGVYSARVGSSFVVLNFDSRLPTIVYLEHFGKNGSLVSAMNPNEGSEQARLFEQVFAQLVDTALAPEDTLAMLQRSARGL